MGLAGPVARSEEGPFGRAGFGPQTIESDLDDAAESALESLRPILREGAVFQIDDAYSGRTTKDVVRPCLVVGPVPSFDAPPEEVLEQVVRVSTRRSWKDFDGEAPRTDDEIRELLERTGQVFTAAGLLPRLDRSGVFETRVRRPVPIRAFATGKFLGFLPRPYVDLVLIKSGRSPTRGSYPPEVA